MKKLSYLLAVALVGVCMTACGGSGNDPESPKNINYIPELTQKILKQPLQTIQETLTQEGFTLDDDEEGNYYYIKPYDGKDNNNGAYELYFYVEDKTANQISALQSISRAKVQDFTTSWSKYIATLHTALTLWVGMIQTSANNVSVYMEGSVLTTLKATLATAVALGQLDQETYDIIINQFGKSKAEYETDIAAIDFTKNNTGCLEFALTTTSLAKKEGKVNGYGYGMLNDEVRSLDGGAVYDDIAYFAIDGDIEEYLEMFDLEELMEMIEEFMN